MYHELDMSKDDESRKPKVEMESGTHVIDARDDTSHVCPRDGTF